MFSATSVARVLTIETKSLFNIASMPPTREDYPIGWVAPAGMEFPIGTGSIALYEQRWISSRPAFLLPVRVLSKLFRRLLLTKLIALHDAGKLAFFGDLAPLADLCATSRGPATTGQSTPSRPSPAPKRCSPTSRARPTGSPSRTGGCLLSTRPASRSAKTIIAAMARPAGAS
jgi:hypothetical protein